MWQGIVVSRTESDRVLDSGFVHIISAATY